MKKLLHILLCLPFIGFAQSYINTEFKLKTGATQYLSFDIPSECEDVFSGKTLPPNIPEGTVCMFVCNDNIILFGEDWDFFSEQNKMLKKEDIIRELNTNKYQKIFKQNIEIDSNFKLEKVSFEYVNDMPALKAEGVYIAKNKTQVKLKSWEIHDYSRKISITTFSVNNNYFSRTIESLMISFFNKAEIPSY